MWSELLQEKRESNIISNALHLNILISHSTPLNNKISLIYDFARAIQPSRQKVKNQYYLKPIKRVMYVCPINRIGYNIKSFVGIRQNQIKLQSIIDGQS